jgi:hypothetical protein
VAECEKYFDVRADGDEGSRIGLGATLYLGDGDEVYDGEGNRTVTVVRGESFDDAAPTRTFLVPADVAPGNDELGGEISEGEIGRDGAESLDDDVCALTITEP